jgi:hypothetical protein
VALTNYLSRYPELAEELRALFSALVLLENVSSPTAVD